MANYFEMLNLPSSLALSSEEIDRAWRTLSQQCHPDLNRNSGGEQLADLNKARDTLLKPEGRLSAWLQLKCDDPLAKNAVLSEDLMALFASVGEALRQADTSIESLKRAQSALGKSIFAARAIAAQLTIQAELGKITAQTSRIEQAFPGFEEAAQSSDFQAARTALGELKFLDKWQRECQHRLLELIAAA
jgi:curved DNA-binding protein CbpA